MTLTPTTEPTGSDAAEGILYFLASVKCSQFLLLLCSIYICIYKCKLKK